MRKLLFVAGLLFLFISSGAQNLTGGIKAGINITNFVGSGVNNIDQQSLIGFHAGGFINFRLGVVSLQPEVLVSSAGTKYKNVDSSFRLIYLSVPVMLKYR